MTRGQVLHSEDRGARRWSVGLMALCPSSGFSESNDRMHHLHLFAVDGAEPSLHVLIKLKLDPGMLVLRRISTVSTLGALTRACNA